MPRLQELRPLLAMPLRAPRNSPFRPDEPALDLWTRPIDNNWMLRRDPRNSTRSYCLALATLLLQIHLGSAAQTVPSEGGSAKEADVQYRDLQRALAQGWSTWDVNSMTTSVLLPEGLGIHVGFLNNANNFGHEFLVVTGVGQGTVFLGPHSWDGSYTELKVEWMGHEWRVQTAHEGADLVLLVTPLDPPGKFSCPPPWRFRWTFFGTSREQP